MESTPFQEYFAIIKNKLEKAFQQENELLQGAKWIADSLKNEGWIYTSGTGHSHMLAEEIFYRAGGFARVRPIFDEGLMLHQSATKSTELEREEGYGRNLMSSIQFTEKDIFLISSNSGRNTASIEMALFAKENGAKVIVITNLKHSQSVESRHPSGKRLFELADLSLDNHGEIGDASISLEGLRPKTGATSTVIGAALLQAMMVQAAAFLIQDGIVPEIFSSSNSDEGEEINDKLILKYKKEIRPL